MNQSQQKMQSFIKDCIKINNSLTFG